MNISLSRLWFNIEKKSKINAKMIDNSTDYFSTKPVINEVYDKTYKILYTFFVSLSKRCSSGVNDNFPNKNVNAV